MAATEYIPGVCNIGPAEQRSRAVMGWVNLSVTVILWIVFAASHTAPHWRLLLFIPAAATASGFLQRWMHFCVGFGFLGVFNFGTRLRKTESVEQAEFRKLDRMKALQITALASLFGVVVGLAGYFLV